MQPLNQLLTHPKDKSSPLVWTDEALSAFNKTKKALANAVLLKHVNLNAPTCLMTDASDAVIGAVLQQYINNIWQPIAFF